MRVYLIILIKVSENNQEDLVSSIIILLDQNYKNKIKGLFRNTNITLKILQQVIWNYANEYG